MSKKRQETVAEKIEARRRYAKAREAAGRQLTRAEAKAIAITSGARALALTKRRRRMAKALKLRST
jgi:hypothetical protein